MPLLADLLGNTHPLFARNIQEMERATDNAGVDTRLIADITESAHRVMRMLGLDPADTSSRELYAALKSSVRSGRAERLLSDTHFVLIKLGDDLVSLCLHDVIDNSHHELSFEGRRYDHAQRHLRAEIVRRYADHDRTSNTMVDEIADSIGLKKHGDAEYLAMAANTTSPVGYRPKFLAIGDIFTDAFIKLYDNEAKIIKEEDGREWLAMPFGQKPPYERVDIIQSVGPSPNAAVSASRLGLDSSLMAWVGSDQVGSEAITHLKSEDIRTDSMVTEQHKATSYWYVLRYGADRTMLVKSEKYSYVWTAPQEEPDWIYLSYIGENSWQLHEDLLAYLEKHPMVKLAFQPGTFHFKWGTEKLAAIYGRSHIVVMNREEAVEVTGASYDDLHALTKAFHELGPKIVVITDGPNGSYASYDGKLVTIPNYPDPAAPFDRTGAGDAFASTIVSGLALGKTMDEALTWAPINSMNVVQELGAQRGLLRQEDIQRFLRDAPEDYKVTEL